jgi:glycosyltransferase involved in cell wall biosynthesis
LQIPAEAAAWRQFLLDTGGEWRVEANMLPPLASVYLSAPLADCLRQEKTPPAALVEWLSALCQRPEVRVVHYEPLDVHFDPQPRLLQIITSLQQGGAERLTLDLAAELRRRGQETTLVTLGYPGRTSFPVPPYTVDLALWRGQPEMQEQILRQIIQRITADLLHVHLLESDSLLSLSRLGLPLMVTVHNTRPGWPMGLATLPPGTVSLFAACSRAVAADVAAAGLAPCRTVWNGLDVAAFAPTPERAAAGAKLRQQGGIAPEDVVLLSLANPRPQKRLERLPEILAEVQRLLAPRRVWLLLAGQAATDPLAVESLRQLEAALDIYQVRDSVQQLGAIAAVAPVLAAADVVLAVSAHEGLSLALLEGLAAGCVVVATAVGGWLEVARTEKKAIAVSPEASAAAFAQHVVQALASQDATREPAALTGFSLGEMTTRYQTLYRRTLAASQGKRGEGLCLITNNFSLGGAQSSARRLLTSLAAQGIPVQAVTLEEHPDYPTPGRQALLQAGVPVVALPPPAHQPLAVSLADLLARLDQHPPGAILFWNTLMEAKVILADALWTIPIYDVSPGEMYFASLERYFAKLRPDAPCRSAADYGALLAGVIVKYQAEAKRAKETLGAPVHVVPNGVPLPPLREKKPDVQGRLRFGTAIRLSPQKKMEHLLAAFRLAHHALPPYVLRIAGGVEKGAESYAAQMRQEAVGLPIEWIGELADPTEFLQELDVFVLVAEPAGCPNASLEAMATGLPVLATDVGGMNEQIIDGSTGRLLPRHDPQAFATALVEVSHSGTVRHQWGMVARHQIERHFLVERMVADYRRICWGS